jgi:diguanylate cyclase (GGDEF)-like protein/PAS domain S-box-containing protein
VKQIEKIKQPVVLYALIIFIAWSCIIAFSAWWNIQIEKRITKDTVINIARSSFNKDQAYRQWATSHGGVYVEPTEKTPPSPWMSHIPQRDIETTTGKKLTLMNPAYMLREMMQDYSELYGIKGRIVGIVYLNKDNEADLWEANAIRSFEKGAKEVIEFTDINNQEYLRLMKPMIMNQKCQKCHGHLGFANGTVRGGVSVSVPMDKYRKNEYESIDNIIMTYLIIWSLGSIGLTIISLLFIKYLNNKEKYLEEMVISSQVFNNTLDAIFITDAKGNIIRINNAFTQLTGYTQSDVIGKNPRILKSTYHDEDFYNQLWSQILEKGFVQHEIWNRNKSGEVFVSIESITSIKDENGDNKYFIATLHDITARKDAENRIVHLAHYDPLTDLPNRALFQDRFSHAITLASREKQKVSLAFIDIDGFKNINDTKGHPMGDKLLIKISEILNSCIRESDTLSRLGGDEFTIIFEHLDKIESVVPICKHILNKLKEEILIDGQSIFITASIGLSVYPDDGDDIHTLIQHADTAMYKAKDNGKNRIDFYEESMTIQTKERVDLETSIQSALNNKEFSVYYQSKILAKDGRVVGMEALVRWISNEKGFISPDKFIPVAEEMHIVDKIDLFVLDTVCKDIAQWIDLGYKDIKVAVNLSGYDFTVTGMFEQIINIVESNNIDPKHIEFEITETYFVNFESKNLELLDRLKEYGFVLSIDDFGTGYSSLSNLQKLPIDILKIDQSFIRIMDENSEDQKLIDTIISLAHSLGLKTIAEGVETPYQLNYLKSKECDFIQGYLESKPLPKDEFIEYLKKKL